MALIPAGDFVPRKSQRKVHVDAYCLDRAEVTVASYADCARADRCHPPCRAAGTCELVPAHTEWGDWSEDARASVYCNGRRPDHARHPMNCVSFEESAEYCAAAGKRLPRGREWEWAAQGARPDASYPWGNRHVTTEPCWINKRWTDGTCESGSHTDDQSPQGVLDLAGNVTEWVEPEGGYVPSAPRPAAIAAASSGDGAGMADGPAPISGSPPPPAPPARSYVQRFGFGASWYARDDAYPRAAIGGIGATSPRTETWGFRCAADVR